jgi:hypothetical protein
MPLVSYPGDDECRHIEKYFGDEFPRKAMEIAAECGIPEATVDAMLTARGMSTVIRRHASSTEY